MGLEDCDDAHVAWIQKPVYVLIALMSNLIYGGSFKIICSCPMHVATPEEMRRQHIRE